MPTNKNLTEYLGDAVYASFDGYQIWLKTNDGAGDVDQIALDPSVYAALVRYARSVWGKGTDVP